MRYLAALSSAALAVLLLPASTVSAQNSAVVPRRAVAFEASARVNLFNLLTYNTRYQQLWTSSGLGFSSGTIREISWRRDGDDLDALPRKNFSRIVLLLSQTSVTPSTMSPELDKNVTATESLVMDQAWSLPALPRRLTRPDRLWSIRFKLQRPFVYSAARGNLLFDLSVLPAPANQTQEWMVDAVSWGSAGEVFRYGSGEPIQILPGRNNSGLRSGGTYTVQMDRQTGPFVALQWLSLSNTTWGSLRLPLDLGPLGAPGQELLASPDFLFTPQQSVFVNQIFFQYYRASWSVTLPRLPALEDRVLFHQGLYFEPSANALGVTMTQGIGFGTGQAPGTPETQALVVFPIFNLGIPILRFNLPQAGVVGGPVTRFTGSFQ